MFNQALPSLISRFIDALRNEGPKAALKKSILFTINRTLSLFRSNPPATKPLLLNLEHAPLISVLVISYNSREDLKKLFPTLKHQTYKNFEVVLVENGNEENIDLLDSLSCPTHYLKTNNIGFAAANNLAYENSRGSFACLINPDTELQEDLLERLLDSFRYDSSVGAVIPKIIFSKKFIDIKFTADDDFSINYNELEESLTYKKFFIRLGKRRMISNCDEILSESREVVLSLPIDGSVASAKISGPRSLSKFSVSYTTYSGNKTYTKNLDNFEGKYNQAVDLSLSDFVGRNIINNAGSGLRNSLPYDKGFAEYDYGGAYASHSYTEAFCGACVLLGPNVLNRRKIFIDEFFAYYEDSELSAFILQNNLKIKYDPTVLVKHAHSTSSSEGSVLWNNLVSRSKAIYEYIVCQKSLNISYTKRDHIPEEILHTLERLDGNLLLKSRSELVKKIRPSLGIYNSYWNTKGGGERHALSIAQYFRDGYDITLISESDFDENAISDYFGFPGGLRKLVTPVVNGAITEMFDVFINSTFCSNLVSKAKASLYIVSFPHRPVSQDFLASYFFLHNSDFTATWAKKFWGQHESAILYPTMFLSKSSPRDKGRSINFLSIGRFTRRGHAKRQDVILAAFLNASKKLKSDAKLHLSGSLDLKNDDDVSYFGELEAMADDSIELHTNISYKDLQMLLERSHFYVHATGVGVSASIFPEKMEHFGIAVVEAILSSAVPIVYHEGGPADTVKKLNCGFTFSSQSELTDIFVECLRSDWAKFAVNLGNIDYLDSHNEKTLRLIRERVQGV